MDSHTKAKDITMAILDFFRRKLKSQPLIDPIDPITQSFRKGKCPDCGGDEFFEGPQGGLCQNFKCATPTCGSRFNIFMIQGSVVKADRI